MANKFNPQGRSKFLFVPKDDIADPKAPTEDELETDASGNDIVDLSCAVLPDGVEGFSNDPSDVDATTMCFTAEETVPGLPTTLSGSLTRARASDTDSENYEIMALNDENAEGYIVVALDGWSESEDGPQEDDIVDVFPVEIASINANPLAAGQIASYTVGFTHPSGFLLNRKVAAGS